MPGEITDSELGGLLKSARDDLQRRFEASSDTHQLWTDLIGTAERTHRVHAVLAVRHLECALREVGVLKDALGRAIGEARDCHPQINSLLDASSAKATAGAVGHVYVPESGRRFPSSQKEFYDFTHAGLFSYAFNLAPLRDASLESAAAGVRERACILGHAVKEAGARVRALDSALSLLHDGDSLLRPQPWIQLCGMARQGIDASGVDLRETELLDLTVIEGFLWTEDTRWPSAMQPLIHLHSREVEPGVFIVYEEGDRGMAEIT